MKLTSLRTYIYFAIGYWAVLFFASLGAWALANNSGSSGLGAALLPLLVLAAVPFFGLIGIALTRGGEADVNELAFRDELTGMGNRHAFMSHSRRRLRGAKPGSVALILLDVDGLKLLNDGCGHQSGDELLRLASRQLATSAAGRGQVYRIGGDEFAVLINRSKGDMLTAVVEDLKPFAAQFETCNHEHLVQMSFGYASSTEREGFDSLFRRADMRLRHLKRQLYASGTRTDRRVREDDDDDGEATLDDSLSGDRPISLQDRRQARGGGVLG